MGNKTTISWGSDEPEVEYEESDYDDYVDEWALKEQLLNNPEFLRKLQSLITFDMKKRDFHFHSTSQDCAKSIQEKGLFLRDRDDLSGTARSMTLEYAHIYEINHMQEFNGKIDGNLTEYMVNRLLEYEWQGCRAVVIIDQPIVNDEGINIIQASGKEMVTFTNAQIVKNAGYVKPQFIVGYIDKENAEVIINPLYYNYEKMKAQLQGESPDVSLTETDYEEWDKAQKKEKMGFANELIKMYEGVESDEQYKDRARNEDVDMYNITQIDNNTMISDLIKVGIRPTPKNALPNEIGEYTYENIITMARYLKAAQNLTITGGTNYLEQFCAVDIVERTLFEMGQSPIMKKFIEQYKTTEDKTPHNPTKAEIDKKLSNDYLSVCQSPKEKIEEISNKIARIDLVKNNNLTMKGDSSLIQSGKVSLMKVLARQQGLVPGDISIKGKKCICNLNERTDSLNSLVTIKKDFNMIGQLFSFPITPEKIKNDTIKGGINISEINKKIRQIKEKILGVFTKNTININEQEDRYR